MSDNQNEVTTPGGRVGARLARLIADSVIHTRQRMARTQSDVGHEIFTTATNHISDEIRSAVGPLFRAMANDPLMTPELKPLFHNLGTARGQAWAWIGGTATGAAAGASLSDVFNNLLAPVTHSIIRANPNGLLSPEAVAASIAREISQDFQLIDVSKEVQSGGLSIDRLQYLIELARTYPTVAELQVLLNRREISLTTFNNALGRLGYTSQWKRHLQELANSDFSLADISAMWNRSIVGDREAISLGARVGFNEDQVRKSLELGGEPLGPEALGEAFRRGIIDQARFNRGIIQGPIRNEWFDVLEALQFRRMSTVDAADAVNQGHMDAAEGRQIAHENGLVPKDFETLLRTAGQPPGAEFAQDAWNRNLITESDFETMFLESRIKNRYLPLLKAMRIRIIPQETVRLLYRNGVYSKEATLDTLLKHGFSPDDAAALVSLEDVRQNDTTRELTRAQIVGMYEDQILDAATTRDLLTGMGFSEQNVELMMALSDVKRAQRFINSAISRVRSAYVTGKIDESEASMQLDSLRVPASQRDELLTIWDIDRTTITKTLTASQIRQAANKNLISREDAIARLRAQGYDEIDADLFLQLTA